MLGKLGDMAMAKKLKKVLEEEELIGEAIGGLIKVTLNGNLKIKSVEIDPQILAPENKEKIENAISEAFNDAQGKLQSVMIKKMQSGEISM